MSSKPWEKNGEAWAWWLALANFEQRPAFPGEMILGRIEKILHLLGDPHLGPKVIHITGTKGKGSTAAMVESILRHCGKRTGLFTSPHLAEVTERFQIGGIPVSHEDLGRAVWEVQCALESLPDLIVQYGLPTFFEVATIAAFLLFAKAQTEWIILEVGLGGRLDSTNICQPVACLITTIGLDHTKILGETLEQIASEKAGIIKSGVPVVSGVTHEPARSVIRLAAKTAGAKLWELDNHFQVSGDDVAWWEKGSPLGRAMIHTPVFRYEALPCPLIGAHQRSNLACAVAVLAILEPPIGLDESALRIGLSHTKWPGRLEILARQPLVIVDGAHNPDSARSLAQELAPLARKNKPVMVVACSADKDIFGLLEPLAPMAKCLVLTRYTKSSRSATTEQLSRALPPGTHARVFEEPDPVKAKGLAIQLAGPDGVVVITGSLFLVGELRGS